MYQQLKISQKGLFVNHIIEGQLDKCLSKREIYIYLLLDGSFDSIYPQIKILINMEANSICISLWYTKEESNAKAII